LIANILHALIAGGPKARIRRLGDPPWDKCKRPVCDV
jgi:hypothetical protein